MPTAPPSGALYPNTLAMSKQLSFAQAFVNGPGQPWVKRGAIADSIKTITSGSTTLIGGVPAMTGNGAYWGGNSASNTYALSTTEGTVLAALVADHGPGDARAHMICHFGSPAFPTGPAVEMLKYNDSNFYFGIISGSNKRITVSAAGKYAAGDMFTMGVTWSPTGQVAYCKGMAIGSNASTGLGDTAGSDFTIGNLLGSAWPWSTSVNGGVLYVLVFDQALTAVEMFEAERDLWWWARQQEYNKNGLFPPTPPIGTTGSGSSSVWIM